MADLSMLIAAIVALFHQGCSTGAVLFLFPQNASLRLTARKPQRFYEQQRIETPWGNAPPGNPTIPIQSSPMNTLHGVLPMTEAHEHLSPYRNMALDLAARWQSELRLVPHIVIVRHGKAAGLVPIPLLLTEDSCYWMGAMLRGINPEPSALFIMNEEWMRLPKMEPGRNTIHPYLMIEGMALYDRSRHLLFCLDPPKTMLTESCVDVDASSTPMADCVRALVAGYTEGSDNAALAAR